MAEVRDHILRAKDEPTTENLRRMWEAVFGLPAWYLLPTLDEGPSTPLVAEIDGQDWLLAFTSLRRLSDFAATAGRKSVRGEVPMLPLTPAEASARVDEVAAQIAGVAFNIGSDETFRAPVEALRHYAATFA